MDVESQNRTTRVWLLLGLLFLAFVWIFCSLVGSRDIQDRLTEQGQVTLDSAGIAPELLTVGGRDAFLEGEVATNEAKIQAEQLIGGIPGIRKVTNNLNIVAPPVVEAEVEPEPEVVAEEVVLRDPNLEICISDCVVTLEGLLSNEDASTVSAEVAEFCGAETITSTVTAAEDVNAATWLNGVIGLLPQFDNELNGACLAADNQSLNLTGTASSEQQRTALAVLADNAVDLGITNNIEVELPELANPNLNFSFADRSCSITRMAS